MAEGAGLPLSTLEGGVFLKSQIDFGGQGGIIKIRK